MDINLNKKVSYYLLSKESGIPVHTANLEMKCIGLHEPGLQEPGEETHSGG